MAKMRNYAQERILKEGPTLHLVKKLRWVWTMEPATPVGNKNQQFELKRNEMERNEGKVLSLIFIRMGFQSYLVTSTCIFLQDKERMTIKGIQKSIGLSSQLQKERTVFNRPGGLCPKPWGQGHWKTWGWGCLAELQGQDHFHSGTKGQSMETKITLSIEIWWSLLYYILDLVGTVTLPSFLFSF